MNKSELIDKIADKAELTKAEAGSALNAILETITQELSHKREVALVGFGTFQTKYRKARTGRNPSTGKPIEIAASLVPQFKAGAVLKREVN